MRRFIKAADTVFDPDTVDIMVGAFDDAWASLVNKGATFAKENNAKTTRQILAKHIIQAAKNGERDQHKLSKGALDALVQLGGKI
jgi:hypothetical protein